MLQEKVRDLENELEAEREVREDDEGTRQKMEKVVCSSYFCVEEGNERMNCKEVKGKTAFIHGKELLKRGC